MLTSGRGGGTSAGAEADHEIHQRRNRAIWDCIRALTVFLGTQTLVDDADDCDPAYVWVCDDICSKFSNCTIYIYALLS
jgi:hypothetical protein